MSTQKPTPQLIEKTSKRYKLICAIGSLLMVVGAVAAWAVMQIDTTSRGESLAAGIGLLVTGGGFVVVLVGSALAWWHHA
jgi:zinc transporter ZupT